METSAFEDMLTTIIGEGYAVELSPKVESNEIEIYVYRKSGNLRQVESSACGINLTEAMQNAYTQVPEKNDTLTVS